MHSAREVDLVRRGLIGASLAGGALASTGASFASERSDANGPAEGRSAGELVIRGGHVLSMDPAIGDLPTGDVHIKDGQIVAVAARVNAPRAEIVDASNTVVMPGFVETHWHMWSSIWRGMGSDAASYFKLHALMPHYTVEDHYVAVRYAALEALNAGITTCHNWAHGMRNFDDAQAEMQALVDIGIRARMSCASVVRGEPTPIEDLKRALAWINAHGQGRLGLGLLLDEGGAHLEAQVKNGRALGLRPITNHGGFLASRT